MSDKESKKQKGTVDAAISKRHLSDINKKIRERVELFMGLRDLTQNDVAERTGLTQSFLSQFLAGQKNMGRDSLIKVAQALGVDISVLMSDKDWTNEQLILINNFFRIVKSEKPTPRFPAIKDLINKDIEELQE
jgi:transcriptional regulator with XRE-family HTH domain